MDKKGAEFYYHHPEYRFNCAQAIVYRWSGDLSLVEKMHKKGSGRAEDGNCGALHGALELLYSDEAKEDLIELFARKAGSNHCRTIRKSRITSCRECVQIADKLLETTKRKHNEDI